MEVAIVAVVYVVIAAFLWRESGRRHKQTQESLYKVESMANKLDNDLDRLTILLDNANRTMREVSEMEQRLAQKDDARELQKRLLEGREGGWRGV